ncbi:hypothetical protein DFA_00724 [Cavenderia fasciculata]|uniref:C3H1-type domain-containing protein n=1 Tax=Cavenderia fasciculata TaxID=261658 RepID=F4PTH7_CACFS|nr:uncharacterized protein DFA_00724 [Cavenderia fasciculata]EGG20859.1 hypothetical protein DFA_00724 [Cavenderia fasciculata]|eukprot:XP_004358709.1 hypothetical protein DFA_00724 [Cavenderia fasciculata]
MTDFQQLNQHSFFGSVMSSNEINWIHPQSNSGLWEQPQQSSPPQQPSNNNNPISKSEDIPPPSHNLTLQYNQQQLQLQQQQDQQQEELEDDVNGQSRYKTELCRSYQETGSCRYGFKCQFAHGGNELRHVSRHPKYKTETCKTFHTVGSCPYGSRSGSSGAGSPGSSVSKSPQLIKSQSEKNINWTSSWNSSDESSVITLGKLPSPPLKQKDMSPPSSSLQTTQQQQQQAQVDDSKRRLAIFRTICSNSWTD